MRKLLRTILRKLNLLEKAQNSYLKIIKLIHLFKVKLFLPIFASSGFLSSFYYTFFSKKYYREHKANLKGIIEHYKILGLKKDSDFLLTHNIHALEKGICMRPRRNIFAIEYIYETVRAYEEVLKKKGKTVIDTNQLKWFHDVLEDYFNITGNHLIINKAKDLFHSLPKPYTYLSNKHIPYIRGKIKNAVSYEDMLNLALQRRSVRWFEEKPVPRELTDKAIEIARLSPSACNRQPIEFRIFDEKEKVQKVAALPSGTSGFGHNFQAICVITGTQEAYVNERDKHAIYIDGALSAMSFMYALETLGLSSCPLNWPDINDREKKMKKLLNLKDYERPIIVVAFGYPDPEGQIAYSEKKPMERFRSYNKL